MMLRPEGWTDIDGLGAGFTTRSGGVSSGDYDSMNLGLSTQDDPENVRINRHKAAESLGFTGDDLAIAGQVHGSEVMHVTEPGLYPGIDGLVTDSSGILLAMSAADCAAVLMVDPVSRVIGACHAGWRGCVGGVVESTIAGMQKLGAQTAELRAWISPCIGRASFEVGEEVAEQFPESVVHRRPDWPRPHVDLAEAIRLRLVAAGCDPLTVTASGRCTMQEPDLFFSYRAEKGRTGRMMGLIGWAPA